MKTVSIALVVLLQVADVVTTQAALSVPGVTEANPVMALAQAKLGAAWWLGKLVLLPAVVIVARKPSALPAALMAAVFAGVVVNNLLWAAS